MEQPNVNYVSGFEGSSCHDQPRLGVVVRALRCFDLLTPCRSAPSAYPALQAKQRLNIVVEDFDFLSNDTVGVTVVQLADAGGLTIL